MLALFLFIVVHLKVPLEINSVILLSWNCSKAARGAWFSNMFSREVLSK